MFKSWAAKSALTKRAKIGQQLRLYFHQAVRLLMLDCGTSKR